VEEKKVKTISLILLSTIFLFSALGCMGDTEEVTLLSLTLSPESAEIPKGRSLVLEAEGQFSDGTSAPVEVAWALSDETRAAIYEVASETGQGLLQTLDLGEVTVTASAKSQTGVSATALVTVANPVAESLAVSPEQTEVFTGQSASFAALATLSDGSVVSVDVDWTTSDESVATIDDTGLATGAATGTATLTATMTEAPFLTALATLTVRDAVPVSLTVTPDPAQVDCGLTVAFSVTAEFSDGKTQTIPVTWSSSDPAIASIDGGGTATSAAVGQVSIVATAQCDTTLTDIVTLTVNPASLVSVQVSPPTASIMVTRTVTFSAQGTYTDGTTQAEPVTWSTSSATVATVDAAGLATGVGGGTATITATAQSDTGVSGTASLTVTTPFTTMYLCNKSNGTSLIDTVPYSGGTGSTAHTMTNYDLTSLQISKDKKTLYLLERYGDVHTLDIATGNVTRVITGTGSAAGIVYQGMYVDGNGILYRPGTSTGTFAGVDKIDPSNWNVTNFCTGPNSSCYFDCRLLNGTMYVPSWGGLLAAKSGGTLSTVFTVSSISVFSSIDADSQGDLYIVDFWNQEILKLRDTNNDGLFYSLGESNVFRNFAGNWIVEIEIDALDAVYLAELTGGATPSFGIWRLTDKNGDGDASDANEGSIWSSHQLTAGNGGGSIALK
jgi:uncharacterized protein YjdB